MDEHTNSPVMGRVLGLARRVALTMVPMMILGESGTGKSWLAQHIHDWSGRPGRLVVVDAGQLAASVAESELFGHETGAFTGATSRKLGLFEQAQGGTIFLDEVGDLPLELQPKLLRVLEAGMVRRVGATSEVGVDVRVIAATCRDVREMMRRGSFRQDLWYRLAAISLTMPPLRQRREDIPRLLDGFALAADVRDIILSHPTDWPGNVRELLWVASAAAQAELTVDEVRPMLPPCAGADVERRVAPALRRAVVLEMARQAGEVRTGQVAQALGMRVDNASRLLAGLVKSGALVATGHGMFAATCRQLADNIKRGEVA
jgi:DNA-binding NtrC family response regulator